VTRVGFEVVGIADAVWDRDQVRAPTILRGGRDMYFSFCYYDRTTRREELRQL